MRDDLDRTHQFDVESTMVARGTAPQGPGAVHALVLADRDGRRRRLRLTEGAFRIGRAPACDLALEDAEVSRQHCVLTVAGDEAILTDLRSTNGTWLEHRRLSEPTTLQPGATFRVGSFLMHYQHGDDAEMRRADEIEQELHRASAYVQALLPPPILSGAVRADWRFVPSGHVGGDAFGFRWLDADRFGLFMMDVAGHGAGSALLAASVMNLLRQRVAVARPGETAPAAVLGELNDAFQMEEQHGLFFSAWYGLFHRTTRRLDYAAAGHHPAFLLVPGAPPAPLGTRNPAIGMLAARIFEADAVSVPAASRLALFSDGAFETVGLDGSQHRLADFLPALAAPAEPGLPLAEALLRAARRAMRPGPFEDDVSILVAEFD